MRKIEFLGKIAITNVIHIPGFYLTAYLSIILFKVLGLDTTQSWTEVLLSNLFLLLLTFLIYGLPILAGLYLILLILDSLVFTYLKLKVRWALIIEWMIISIPFFYWAVRYEFWMWFTLSISFLITQLMREGSINKFIENKISKP